MTAADQSSVALEAELSETIDSFDRAFSEGDWTSFGGVCRRRAIADPPAGNHYRQRGIRR